MNLDGWTDADLLYLLTARQAIACGFEEINKDPTGPVAMDVLRTFKLHALERPGTRSPVAEDEVQRIMTWAFEQASAFVVGQTSSGAPV